MHNIRVSLFLVSLILLSGCSTTAQEITTIILVRHAEKAKDQGSDPALTDEGVARSAELARVLKDMDIDHIYSTPFVRTRETVRYLAEAKNIEVKEYNPSKLDEVMELVNDNRGKTLLFSGHSNTTPTVLNKLVGEERYQQLDDSDYDNLYIVTYLNANQVKVVSLEYGEDSEL
ncbi:hypothetical protein E1176_13345 [Fulvivirga sp. RKSG066]|uniref:SixA phosphatase family protein n=1 Tax=Fulvivirga aurantia TaxID=2529383 RepID=UPI0012BCDECC|nr:histidine phosphatase family protein [Fulvivirga aurantia]MTI22011.1 hypothetical protein [Fulvivirga aurantia]